MILCKQHAYSSGPATVGDFDFEKPSNPGGTAAVEETGDTSCAVVSLSTNVNKLFEARVDVFSVSPIVSYHPHPI